MPLAIERTTESVGFRKVICYLEAPSFDTASQHRTVHHTGERIRSGMAFSFTDTDIKRIEAVLEVPAKWDGKVARFELSSEESGRRITLEIHTSVPVPDEIDEAGLSNLISVYANSSFLQLQGCTGFIASKDLGEVIFVAKTGHAANGLVVERAVGCSLYANVDTRLFSTDFTQLPPELIMSSVALSVTESLFDDLG